MRRLTKMQKRTKQRVSNKWFEQEMALNQNGYGLGHGGWNWTHLWLGVGLFVRSLTSIDSIVQLLHQIDTVLRRVLPPTFATGSEIA